MAHVTGFYDLPYELKIKIIRCIWSVETYITLYWMIEFKELVKDSVIHLYRYANTKGGAGELYMDMMPEVASFQFDKLMIEGEESEAFPLPEILQPANKEKFFIVSLQADNTTEFMGCMHIPIMLSTVCYVHHTVILNTEERHEITQDYFSRMQIDFALCQEFSHEMEISCAKELDINEFSALDASQRGYLPSNESSDYALELILRNTEKLYINTTRLNNIFPFKLDFQSLTELKLNCIPESFEYYLDVIKRCIYLERLTFDVKTVPYDFRKLPYLEIRDMSLDKLETLTIWSQAYDRSEMKNCHFKSLCQLPIVNSLRKIENCSFGGIVACYWETESDMSINNLSLPSLKCFNLFEEKGFGTRDLNNIFTPKLSYFHTNKIEHIAALDCTGGPSQDRLSSLETISVEVNFNRRSWNLRNSFVKMVHLVKNSKVKIIMIMRCSKCESRRQKELYRVEITPEAQLLGDKLKIQSDLDEMIVLEN